MAFITSSYLSDVEVSAQRLLDRVEGLLAIVISDKDGVTVFKVVHPSIGDSSSASKCSGSDWSLTMNLLAGPYFLQCFNQLALV